MSRQASTRIKLTLRERELLEKWPQEKTLTLNQLMPMGFDHNMLERLERGGYVVLSSRHRGWHSSWKRSTLPLPPLKFKPEPANSIWPWGVDEHEYVISTSPAAAARDMLMASNPSERVKVWRMYPVVERYTLTRVRKALTAWVRGPAPRVNDLVSYYLPTPQRAARLLAAMMVVPCCNENGKPTRFKPMDPTLQLAILRSIPQQDHEDRFDLLISAVEAAKKEAAHESR